MALSLVTEAPALAGPSGPSVFYAYATGASNVSGCTVLESTPATGCSLAQALTAATLGTKVELETAGASGHYVGNWTVPTVLTLEPGPGVANPILDGTGFTGPVLNLPSVSVTIDNITIENGDDTNPGPAGGPSLGGAIYTYGGTVNISGTSFIGNQAAYGGAIVNASGDQATGVTGTLNIVGSTFTDNIATAGDGGAINSSGGGSNAAGTLHVTGSTFTGNQAERITPIPPFRSEGNGGAIDSSDESTSDGTLTVLNSTFSSNTATEGGGAIDAADGGGAGSASVTGSTFTSNSAIDGGAINNADNAGIGTLTVTTSTFVNNTASEDGGAINNGDRGGTIGHGTAIVSTSTLYANTASDGGGIDTGGDGSINTALTATATTFDANVATAIGVPGDSINNSYGGGASDTAFVAADIFNGNCAPGNLIERGLQRRVGHDLRALRHRRPWEPESFGTPHTRQQRWADPDDTPPRGRPGHRGHPVHHDVALPAGHRPARGHHRGPSACVTPEPSSRPWRWTRSPSPPNRPGWLGLRPR